MKDKEYGIKLNLNTNDFKQKLEDIKNKITDFSKKAKENLFSGYQSNYDIIDLQDLAEEYEKALEDIQNKLSSKNLTGPEKKALEKEAEEYEQLINGVAKATEVLENPFKNATNFFFTFGQKIRDLKNGAFLPYIEKTEEAKEATEEFHKKASININIFENFSRGINKGVNAIKRFSLSLLGVRSVYSILSRATNAYMSQDDAMHNKMQANWIALGAIMEPIVTKIINLFTRLVGYVNVFIKAFTGGKVDLIGKALSVVEKKSNSTTKAVKGLNKELANFDEITNLNFDQGGGGVDDTGIPSIEDYLKDLQNMELNPRIVEMMNNLGKSARELWGWCQEVFKSFKDWGVGLEAIIPIIGLITGGITGGLIGAVMALILKVQELQRAWAEQDKAEEELAKSYLKTQETIYNRIVEINGLLSSGTITDQEQINQLEEEKANLIKEGGTNYHSFEKQLQNGKKFTQEQVTEMNNLKKKIEEVTNADYGAEIDVEAVPTYQKSKWEKFSEGLSEVVSEWLSPIFGKVTGAKSKHGGGGRHFAKGNVAYGPTVAEFGEYSGANTNPEITTPQNIMRQTLYEALSDALPLMNTGGSQDNREIVLNVNGREFARATYGDYQTEAKRVGSSNIAIRRA